MNAIDCAKQLSAIAQSAFAFCMYGTCQKSSKKGPFCLRCTVLTFSGNGAKRSIPLALHGVSIFRKWCKMVGPFRSVQC